jgi:transposase
LAQLLRADLLPEAWIAPAEVRQLRALLRHRIQLVRLRTLLRNRIHAVLAGHGHDRPSGYWSGPGRSWLTSLDPAAVSAEVVPGRPGAHRRPGIGHRPARRRDPRPRQVRPRVKVLTALPGAGPFTALVLLAAIGDMTRFGPARKLAAWAGLTPTVRGPDRMVRHGHIPQAGPSLGAVDLVRGRADRQALTRVRRPVSAIARGRGTKIATTAIARKLLTRACHLLTEQQVCAQRTCGSPKNPHRRRAPRAHNPKMSRSPVCGDAQHV